MKNKTQLYVAFRRPISATNRHNVKGWKMIVQEMAFRKKVCSVLISDKIEFKIEKVIKDKDRHFIMIRERINSSRRHNVYQPICTKPGSTKVYKAILNS